MHIGKHEPAPPFSFFWFVHVFIGYAPAWLGGLFSAWILSWVAFALSGSPALKDAGIVLTAAFAAYWIGAFWLFHIALSSSARRHDTGVY